MARTLFQEKQTIRSVKWIWWIIIPVSASTVISILYGVYLQLILGQPWGIKPMSDAGLAIFAFISLSVLAFVLWVILSVRLETVVDREGIRYRYFPHMRNFKKLHRSDLESFTVRKLSFLESRRRGYRRSISGRQRRLIVHGRNALTLTLKDGKKITIGTQRPHDFGEAIKRMMAGAETD
jgi:hypothetical protein